MHTYPPTSLPKEKGNLTQTQKPFDEEPARHSGKLRDVKTENLINELTALLGADAVRAAEIGSLPAGWPVPFIAVAPTTIEPIPDIVRAAERAGAALIPHGGGTMLQTGYPPSADRPYLLLDMRRADRILDYQPDDLTVTCEPGVTLRALQEALVAGRQCLALDVPLPDRATLGGIVSANASGFDRPAYGAPRDLLIGVRAVMAGGIAVKGGGKVVKNVAGYDVCKLFTGAWGTLGVLTELTFKVRTRPETSRMVAWKAPDLSTAARVGLAQHHARLAGTSFIATNELDGNPALVVGLQGLPERVDWQAQEYGRLAASAGLNASPQTLSPTEVDVWRNLQARIEPGTPIATRIACLPTEVAVLLDRLRALPDLAITAHIATGIVSLAAHNPAGLPADSLSRLLPPGSHLTWTRLDPQVADTITIERWGRTGGEIVLHRRLKQSLDPGNTFSPGRFLNHL
jgi:glycolate oxidase FAD binding subunit